VLQPNVKFASLREQAIFYGGIPDDDPIDYHDVEVEKGGPEELTDANEGFLTSAEQAGMSRDGAQSLRQLVTECKDVFRLKLGAEPPANVKHLVIKLRDGAEPVRMSACKYAPPQLKFMRDKIRKLEELGLVYKNTGAEWASPPLILPKPVQCTGSRSEGSRWAWLRVAAYPAGEALCLQGSFRHKANSSAQRS
jgi:hypothetical protein